MFSQCEQVKTEYRRLQTLLAEFQRALAAKNQEESKRLSAELKQKRDALQEKLWPFEDLPQKELRKQYERQRDTLQRVGILEMHSSGELGIKAIDGKEYAFPAYREIAMGMRKDKEMFKTKTKQGFNRLLIVPFGMKLDDLIEKYRQVVLKHHQEGKLLATKESPSDPDEPLELNETQPIWVWDKYPNADISEGLVYFPEEFSPNHQGKTKNQILKEQGGFNLLLMENLPNIPRKNKGEKVKRRKQLEAGLTPNQYFETLKTNLIYQGETGMTPEEQIMYAIQYLEENSQVIDDWQGKGSISYQLGAYFPASGGVPRAYWSRGDRRAYLGRGGPGRSDPGVGVRAAVRVKTLKFGI